MQDFEARWSVGCQGVSARPAAVLVVFGSRARRHHFNKISSARGTGEHPRLARFDALDPVRRSGSSILNCLKRKVQCFTLATFFAKTPMLEKTAAAAQILGAFAWAFAGGVGEYSVDQRVEISGRMFLRGNAVAYLSGDPGARQGRCRLIHAAKRFRRHLSPCAAAGLSTWISSMRVATPSIASATRVA